MLVPLRDANVREMKLTAPKTVEQYFKITEHSVRHLYEGLASCWSYYKRALGYWDISQIDKPITEENNEAIQQYLKLSKKYFDLKFSEAMFAGGILQIAYMAIKLYSSNKSIPEGCIALVEETNKSAIPFCIGRECYGIPIGLIIYAARNQYSHWDDKEPHKVTRNVFNTLSNAFCDTMMADLAFELTNPTINVYANEILLTAMNWKTYEIYLHEMKTLLKLDTAPRS